MTLEEYINDIKQNNIYYLKQKQIRQESKKEKLKNIELEKLKLKQQEEQKKKNAKKIEPKIISNLNLAHLICDLNPTVDIKVYTLYNSSILISFPNKISKIILPTNLYISNNKIYDKNSSFFVHFERSL